jgi:hypothetical protein
VANTRHHHPGRKPAKPQRGPQAKTRARERLAAERAARKRAEARRRLLLPIAAVTAVLAIVVALVTVKLTAAPAHLVASESPATAAVVRQVTAVPAAVLANVNPGEAITSLEPVKTSVPPLTIDGKPASARPASATSGPTTSKVWLFDMALPSITPNPCSAKTAPMMTTTVPAAISSGPS